MVSKINKRLYGQVKDWLGNCTAITKFLSIKLGHKTFQSSHGIL